MVNLVGPQQLKIGGEANGKAEVAGDSVENARQELVDGLQAEIRGGRTGGGSGSSNFDPLACYHCGVRGHIARDCPPSSTVAWEWQCCALPWRIIQIRAERPKRKRKGSNGSVRVLNVLYDEAGNEYPVDDAGQLYVPLGFETKAIEGVIEEEKVKETKN